MKAKEYFEKYVNENQDKTKEWKIIKAFRDIFYEAEIIAKSRNVKTDSGYISIFKELNQKANSLCKMVNEIDDFGLKQNAFMIFVQQENPSFFKSVYPNGL